MGLLQYNDSLSIKREERERKNNMENKRNKYVLTLILENCAKEVKVPKQIFQKLIKELNSRH